jgi:hypothetical protein
MNGQIKIKDAEQELAMAAELFHICSLGGEIPFA